jgi:hypothetical protein
MNGGPRQQNIVEAKVFDRRSRSNGIMREKMVALQDGECRRVDVIDRDTELRSFLAQALHSLF